MGGFHESGDNRFAVGEGVAQAAFDQQHAVALDALREHRGPFVLVLEAEVGYRMLGSMPLVAYTMDGQPPDTRVGNELAKRFLRRVAAVLVDASSHYGRRTPL